MDYELEPGRYRVVKDFDGENIELFQIAAEFKLMKKSPINLAVKPFIEGNQNFFHQMFAFLGSSVIIKLHYFCSGNDY
ncbi:hypothetical protein GS400_07110 [Pontibacillus sp. HMF3514]|nr:hypothetical protein [Pontibacillus sp. HMF3514]QHE51816.1 hypothetical protein GS400_07110 [Pontibacillus sp. HMF3514]